MTKDNKLVSLTERCHLILSSIKADSSKIGKTVDLGDYIELALNKDQLYQKKERYLVKRGLIKKEKEAHNKRGETQ